MTNSRTYPEGVTSWIDIEHQDLDSAKAFYGGLFGWAFTEATPPGAPFRYFIAKLDGLDVAGLGGPPEGSSESVASAWNTYIAVDNADDTAARVEAGFYSKVFGWVFDDLGFATMIRVPGYGDQLAPRLIRRSTAVKRMLTHLLASPMPLVG